MITNKRKSSALKNGTNVPKIAVAIVSLGINSSQSVQSFLSQDQETLGLFIPFAIDILHYRFCGEPVKNNGNQNGKGYNGPKYILFLEVYFT